MNIELDPQLKAVTEAAADPDAPHPVELPLETLRAWYVMSGQTQGRQDIECDEIRDLQIPGPGGDIGARLYVPKGKGGEVLPGLIYIHGGGFMIGDLDTHDSLCRQLADSAGIRVIAIDYRLAPEHKFPAAVDDAVAAAEWVCGHAAELGMDGGRIAIGGDSAGGNLSAVVCNHFAAVGGPKLAFQLLIYPATDAAEETESRRQLAEGVTLDKRILDYFYVGYVDGSGADRADPRISPLRADSVSGVPPAHVVTAQYDPLKDEGIAYADKLRAAGVAVSHRDYAGLMHNFVQQTGVVDAANQAVEDMAAQLRAALG